MVLGALEFIEMGALTHPQTLRSIRARWLNLASFWLVGITHRSLKQEGPAFMTVTAKPNARPKNPNFSSGPCAKRPGWSVEALNEALVGRSHRAKPAKARIQEVSDRSRAILGIP